MCTLRNSRICVPPVLSVSCMFMKDNSSYGSIKDVVIKKDTSVLFSRPLPPHQAGWLSQTFTWPGDNCLLPTVLLRNHLLLLIRIPASIPALAPNPTPAPAPAPTPSPCRRPRIRGHRRMEKQLVVFIYICFVYQCYNGSCTVLLDFSFEILDCRLGAHFQYVQLSDIRKCNVLKI